MGTDFKYTCNYSPREKVQNGVGTVFEDIMTNSFPKTDEHQAQS